MDEIIHRIIRAELHNCGVWAKMNNAKIYTVEDLIAEFGSSMTSKLIELLQANVSRVQYYFDERIIEPKTNDNE